MIGERVAKGALYAVLVAALLFIITRHAFRTLGRDVPAYGEGSLLLIVERMRSEHVSAQWVREPPYTLNPYGPGYFWAVALLSPLTPWDHTILPGRLVSLAAAFATAILIGVLVFRSTRLAELAAASALMFLVAPIVMLWCPFFRVDSLAVLFALGSYAALESRRFGVPLAAVLVVAGSLVKQSVVFALGPLALYLLLARRWRDAAVLGALVAGLGALAWGSLFWASDGYYLGGAVRGHLSKFSAVQAVRLGYDFLCSPVGVGGALTAAYLVLAAPRQWTESIYPLAFVVATLVAVASASKEGANVNYFLEPTALACLLIGRYGLPALYSLHPLRARWLLAALALVLVLEDTSYMLTRLRHGLPPVASPPSELVARLAGAEVLADGFGHCAELVLTAGKHPVVNDPWLFRVLVESGSMDVGEIIRRMESGEIGHLVLYRTPEEHRTMDHWSPAVLDAMQTHYVPLRQWQGMYLYAHRKRID